jgi:hypothetical protein
MQCVHEGILPSHLIFFLRHMSQAWQQYQHSSLHAHAACRRLTRAIRRRLGSPCSWPSSMSSGWNMLAAMEAGMGEPPWALMLPKMRGGFMSGGPP